MSEDFSKIVMTPEQAAKKLRELIEKKNPGKYIREKRRQKNAKGIQEDWAELRDLAAVLGLNVAKASAWLAAGGSQFLLTLARWTTLDNKYLRKMEEKFKSADVDKKQNKFSKFFSSVGKKYPNASAHLLWLLCLTALSFGAYSAGANLGPDIAQKVKEITKGKKYVKFKNFVIDPTADNESWQHMIDAIHPYVLSHIISSEGFIKRVYNDNFGSGTLTIGSGFALMDREHRAFAEKTLGRRIGNGSSITIEENRILVSAWLYKKVYPKIRREIKVPMDSKLFVILSVAAYNKGSNTYGNKNTGHPVAEAINKGKSKKDIANIYLRCFAGIKGTSWSGLANKYAVAALYYLGDIDDVTILDAVAEAPYTLENYLPKDQQCLLIYDSDARSARAKGVHRIDNIKELLLKEKHRVTKGSLQEPVREYLTMEQVDLIENGLVDLSGATISYSDYAAKSKTETNIASESEKLNADGEDLFLEKKYKAAIKKFKSALEADPQNYIAYSNLAISYYKIGQFENGLKVVQKLINSSFINSMPNDIKGYTYYNAALCRVAIGDKASDIAEKKHNYAMAQKNLDLAKKFSGNTYPGLSKILNKKMHSGELSEELKFDDYKHAIRNLEKTSKKSYPDINLLHDKSKGIA